MLNNKHLLFIYNNVFIKLGTWFQITGMREIRYQNVTCVIITHMTIDRRSFPVAAAIVWNTLPVITICRNLSPAAKDILVSTVISGHHHPPDITNCYRGLCNGYRYFSHVEKTDWLIDWHQRNLRHEILVPVSGDENLSRVPWALV